MSKKGVATVLAAMTALGIATLLASADGPATKKDRTPSKVQLFMRAKLINSQNVLEGLVTEDFDKIRDGAEKMIVMSKAAEWRMGSDEMYAHDTAEFVSAAQDLIRQAKDRKVDAATLSYLQLTISCLNCHKHVHGIKTSGIGRDTDKRLAAARLNADLARMGAGSHNRP